MFLRLEHRTRRTLSLFLCCFIILINATAYFIIRSNHRQNCADLALTHARQQARNVELHMRLLEETAARIVQDDAILRQLSEDSLTDQISPRLGDYLASSVYIQNLMILRPDGREYRRLNVTAAPQPEPLAEGGDSFWMVRPREEGWLGAMEGVLSYVVRIRDRVGGFLGYFILDSALDRIFSLCQLDGGSFSSETACLLMRDGGLIVSGRALEGEPPARQAGGSYTLKNNTLYYYTNLLKSQDQLVQRLPLPVGRQALAAGGMLLACTVLCILFCSLLVRLLTDSMIVPLRQLQQKIDAFLQREGR